MVTGQGRKNGRVGDETGVQEKSVRQDVYEKMTKSIKKIPILPEQRANIGWEKNLKNEHVKRHTR